MAGIAGTYQQVDGELAAARIGAALAHRGRGEGVYDHVDERLNVHLAHRHVPAPGRCATGPMAKDGLVVALDGELYNGAELRSELASSGASFVTPTSTEVVLEAWRRWGTGCLRKFRGMFALAVVDERTGSLFLARDHFGIRPLHFMPRKDGVVFASELKALMAGFSTELEMEPSALIASMLFGWVPPQRCALSGVHKLQPGTCIEFRPEGTQHTKTFFDAAEVAAAAAAGPPVDVGEVIDRSVGAHLPVELGAGTGAPVAMLLSGGLSSALMGALASRAAPGMVAYNLVLPGARAGRAMSGEAAYARGVARRYGIELVSLEVEAPASGTKLLGQLGRLLDEPVSDPVALSSLLMFGAAASAGAHVLLSGLGGRPLFAPHRRRGTNAAGDGRGEEEQFRRSYTLYGRSQLIGLVSAELSPDVDDVVAEHVALYHDNTLASALDRARLAEARAILPGLDLACSDQAGAAASVQVRLPFVDPLVFRAAFAPSEGKGSSGAELSGTDHGAPLADLASAWLPPTQQSPAPAAPLWAFGDDDLNGLLDDVLLSGDLLGTGFLATGPVRCMVDDHRTGRHDFSEQLWQMLTLETWYRQSSRAGVGF